MYSDRVLPIVAGRHRLAHCDVVSVVFRVHSCVCGVCLIRLIVPPLQSLSTSMEGFV